MKNNPAAPSLVIFPGPHHPNSHDVNLTVVSPTHYFPEAITEALTFIRLFLNEHKHQDQHIRILPLEMLEGDLASMKCIIKFDSLDLAPNPKARGNARINLKKAFIAQKLPEIMDRVQEIFNGIIEKSASNSII